MFSRPSKNLVIAAERGGLATFRPSNQANLLAADPMNPSVSDASSAMQDAGVVQSGNGAGDNGLGPQGSMRRFMDNRSRIKAQGMAKLNQIQRTGSPNAPSVDYSIMSINQATASMPNAPGTGRVMVARVQRDNNTAWQINTFQQYGRQVHEAQLLQSSPSGQAVLAQSPILDTEADARNFIQAHEFQRTNVVPDTWNKNGFNRDLFAKTYRSPGTAVNVSTNSASGANMVPYVQAPPAVDPGEYEPDGYSNMTPTEIERLELDGLGAMDTQTTLLVAAAVIGGLYLCMRRK